MRLQVSTLQDWVPGIAYAIAGIAAATIVIAKLSKSRKLDAIPTVGSNSWFGWPGHKSQINDIEVMQEGYEKYKSAPFKVADRYRWVVVLGGRQHMEELRKAPEDAISFFASASELVQMKYTAQPEMLHNLYHVETIRSHLTKNLSSLYPEIRDEISVSFDEVLDLNDNEWKSIPAISAIYKVVCRTSNRIFVGFPLCRDNDWVDLTLRYTLEVVVGANLIWHFPGFLAPLVGYFAKSVLGTQKRATKYLAPIINERLKLQEDCGKDRTDKPKDLLSCMLDDAPEGPERTARLLTARILGTNFAAIHTSAISFYHALFFLAENPHYIPPLRKEVESIVENEGWSKVSLGKMHKIDSFLKESQRLAGATPVSLMRKAVKDFTFSDGTFIPKGTSIVAPALCLHLDNKHYDNAHVFDPFRFSNMHDEGGNDARHQFVSTSMEYLAFGHGKHACPGRFIAAAELKSMLAHVVMSYDVKVEDKKPRSKVFSLPDPAAKVMFRRRAH